MPTIPWLPGTDRGAAAPEGAAGPPLVMASRLELRSLWSVPGFLLLSLVVLRQARRSPGLIGTSLRAEPLRRTFWTLSAWRDQEALNAFDRTGPHARSVRRLRPGTRSSVFVFWSTERDRLPVTWDEARRRLDEQVNMETQGT
ncbi:DUF3291 domain-containing protein [Streptomyces sp. NPDC002265]|uniref:DUF3291 domain-containing protein n=1 Tax=Streptomyces sp. NPDC002265 TaxID=3154415 RepID=UPI00331DC1D1